MMAHEYDLVILGGGIGGYVAAIRAAKLGLKTAIVEKGKIGGTCLHKGCIPSKSFLESAYIYKKAKSAETFGIEVTDVKVNFSLVKKRKEQIVENLYKGVQMLLKKGKVDIYEGHGRILGPSIFSPLPGTISVEMNNGSDNEMLVPKNVLIATGSSPRAVEGIAVDGKRVMFSDHAFQMEELPQSIIIVGGGVIGIEWASMLADFGVNVTILEAANQILPNIDEEIVKYLTRELKKKKVAIHTNCTVLPETVNVKEDSVQLEVDINGEIRAFDTEKILISVGRSGNIKDIGLENTSINTKDTFIEVNEFYQTNEKHIYAVGDVIGGDLLAHTASYEGLKAVEHIVNGTIQNARKPFVPKCIYSSPEVASVGMSEKEAKESGKEVKVATIPFGAIGKSHVHGEHTGIVKMIKDRNTEDLLGVHMIGPKVTELISESTLALNLNATPWEIAETIHPHPSLSEVMQEVAMLIEDVPIHY